MTRNITIGETEQIQLVVDDQKPVVTDYYIVKGGQGVLTRGTPLGVESATGKLKKCLSTNEDGTEDIFAILPEGVDTTSGDIKIALYVEGACNPAAIQIGRASCRERVYVLV